MAKKRIKDIFYLLVFQLIVFIIYFTIILAPGFIEALGKYFIFVSWVIFILLGLIYTISIYKSKIKNKIVKYMLLSGWASILIIVGILLHNLFYGLAVWQVDNHPALSQFFETMEITFFFFSIIICPIVYIIGVIGSIIIYIKNKE